MSPQPFRVDPHRALRRALAALAEEPVESLSDEPWASMTFDGRRHRFRIDAAARPDCLAGIADLEFDLPGHLVAEIAFADQPREGETGIVIEALTIAVE